MFRVLTPIIRSSYNCNYSFWYRLTDLVITKYFGNSTTKIKRIAYTYPDLLPSAFVVELELNNKSGW